MEHKTQQESEIFTQMVAMLADQFSHQTGNNITINRMHLADMLAKQTMHGIEIGKTDLADKADVMAESLKEEAV